MFLPPLTSVTHGTTLDNIAATDSLFETFGSWVGGLRITKTSLTLSLLLILLSDSDDN
ncbi:hypothetical protein DPMN_022064 [Dreissena polymorpha]|uniref:Uncharacterized protein n=1 Tax=Dreissena polymorpha TaxID=45954 RepID=A0A9D4SBG3_DREPO|nr:hypothetical protein DPMN_022064 [Dreissena polymorpha]